MEALLHCEFKGRTMQKRHKHVDMCKVQVNERVNQVLVRKCILVLLMAFGLGSVKFLDYDIE